MARIRIRGSIGLRRISFKSSRVSRHTPASVARATRKTRESIRRVVENFGKVVKGIREVTPDALRAALEPVLRRSQELVPVDTGALKNSAFLDVDTVGSTIKVGIGYAKGGTPTYAAIVHEDLTAVHMPPTRAKFLETAFNEQSGEIEDRIRDFLENFLDG